MGYNFFNFYNFLTRESSVMLNETPILKFCDKKQFLKFLARINLDLYGWNYAARPERAEALSPGQRPGLLCSQTCRPVRAKALKLQGQYIQYIKAVALTGRIAYWLHTQGVALG